MFNRGSKNKININKKAATQDKTASTYSSSLDPAVAAKIKAKQDKRQARKNKLKEKIDMYDMIIANLIAGKSIITPTQRLGNSNIQIGFSNLSSETQVTKYFLVRQFPDFLQPRLLDYLRYICVKPGVKIDYFIYGEPYKINWDSPEMKNKMTVWKRYVDENSGPINVFDYRSQRSGDLVKRRIVLSTKYLNDAELNQKRSLVRAAFVIAVTANRDTESILNMIASIQSLKEQCSLRDIKIRELRINLVDWLQYFGPFSLKPIAEISDKVSYKVMTDDLLANFNSYKQGRIGVTGVPLGIDVDTNEAVIRKFKADPDAAENWLISAGTGGGKSYWIKSLLTYLMADGFVITVMDYEGDEYTNLANFIAEANPNDVKVISMGKGSTTYFDPCAIPRLTGDPDVDNELKESAISYIMAIFRVIVGGVNGTLTLWEERVLSTAIQRMYDNAGVTENQSTWHRSSNLRLKEVYEEIKYMVESRELVDPDSENVQHKAAMKIANAASVYFEEGESKAGTFKNPMSADELYDGKFIVFSFGMKGAGNSTMDPTILALKQLGVAYVSIQISNYCKYVKHCFNVKVWEEYQRWINSAGSGEIISNAMTGGRKRGDVNFIITNDLANIIDDSTEISKKLRLNIQNYAIGNIKDSKVREEFCSKMDLIDCKPALDRIAKAHQSDEGIAGGNGRGSGSGNRYRHSFCVVLDNGKKAIVKSKLPAALGKSKIFKTGVLIKE